MKFFSITVLSMIYLCYKKTRFFKSYMSKKVNYENKKKNNTYLQF